MEKDKKHPPECPVCGVIHHCEKCGAPVQTLWHCGGMGRYCFKCAVGQVSERKSLGKKPQEK